MKITDLLGTMGGLIKALLMVGFVLVNPIAKLSLKTEMINRLFNFEGVRDNNKEEEEEGRRGRRYLLACITSRFV